MRAIEKVLNEKDNDYSILEKTFYESTGTPLSLCFNCPPSDKSSVTKPLTVSVVIPTWNASTTIRSCLTAIEQSSFNIKFQNRLQVIVVDDGSTDKTWEVVKSYPFLLHLTLIKQSNYGQAKALNTGISVAEGDIIISCDADMILNYYAIEHFVIRLQILPNVLLAGFRADISGDSPIVKPDNIRQKGCPLGINLSRDERITYSTPGWPYNMCLASGHYKKLGNARGLWMPDDNYCEDPWRLSDLVFGALFSLPKAIYLKLGGYDERLQGWGSTDGLLAAKAISEGQYIIPIYSSSGLHISHPFRTKDKKLEYAQNRKKFFKIIQTEMIDNHQNWISRAKNRIIDSYTREPSKSVAKIHTRNVNVSPENKVDNLLAIGDYAEAQRILIKDLSKSNDYSSHLKLGKVFIETERFKEAITVLENISSSNLPSEVSIELAIAKAADGQFNSAHSMLYALSEINPKTKDLTYWFYTPPDTHIKQGRKYFEQGFYQIARRCFEAALISEPNNQQAIKYRSLCME